MERGRNSSRGVKLGIILAVVAGIFVAVPAGGGPSAYADPGRTSACDSCHSYPPSTLNVTTDITSKTVSPGGSFVVNVSWTGGGTGGATNEINWPYTLNNTLFSPSPRIPYSGSASGGTTASTLTAPATPGTYTVRVYGATGSGFQTDYQDISVTVSAPPDTTGPVTPSVSASPNPTAGTASVALTASVSDTTTGGSNIAAAEYFVDAAGAAGSGTAMSASDGSFNSATESVRATVSVSGLPVGSHTLYVRGRDAAGNWGATASGTFTVSAPPTTPSGDNAGPLTYRVTASLKRAGGSLRLTITAIISDFTTGGSNITAAEYFMDTVGVAGGGTAMTATDGSFTSARERVQASIDVAGLPAGSHTLYVRGRDAASNWGPTTSAAIKIRSARGDHRYAEQDDDDDEDGEDEDEEDDDDGEDDD